MSYDIFVQDLPPGARSIHDIPADFRPAPIGKRSAIVEAIKEAAPAIDFSDPTWGRVAGDNWSIELSISKDEICSGFAFHVRGDPGAFLVVDAVLQRLGLRALDPQEHSGLFEARSPKRDGFEKWRAHHERVMGKNEG